MIEDVRRFGTLDTFSTYPFESMLGRIKRLLKTGSRPLAQVAKRLIEQDIHLSSEQDNTSRFDTPVKRGPKLKNMINNSTVKADIHSTINNFVNGFKYYLYNRAELDNYELDCSSDDDRWIIIKKGNNLFDVIKVENLIATCNNQFFICGRVLKSLRDIFRLPFPSSYLLMYSSENCENLGDCKIFSFSNVASKLFKLKKFVREEEEEEVVDGNDCFFIPILHTINI